MCEQTNIELPNALFCILIVIPGIRLGSSSAMVTSNVAASTSKGHLANERLFDPNIIAVGQPEFGPLGEGSLLGL